jgi:hypothetical protein
MATQTQDIIRDFAEFEDVITYPVVANDVIFRGSAVGLDATTREASPLVADETFVGFAVRQCDNTGGAAKAKRVEVRQRGAVVLPITSVASTDVGKKVYASDDNTFTLSADDGSGGDYTLIGVIRDVPTSGLATVEFDALTTQLA